jgi:hypothetical protein
MSLPIDIHKLLNGRVIEWDRLEFKTDWEDIVHVSFCVYDMNRERVLVYHTDLIGCPNKYSINGKD